MWDIHAHMETRDTACTQVRDEQIARSLAREENT